MRENLIHGLPTLVVVGVAATVYWRDRTTTYRTADGACQSLTVEDECD